MQDFAYQPSQETLQATNIFKLAKKIGFSTLDQLYSFADSEPEKFWPHVIDDCNIHFGKKYSKVLDSSSGIPFTKWFIGGLINAEYNCVGRWKNSRSTAIKWEEESGKTGKLSYRELDSAVGKLAGALLSLGISKGDRIGIFMPLSKEAVEAMYAVIRIGAVAVPIFSGYAEEAVRKRVEDAGIIYLFASSHYSRKGKSIDMLQSISGLRELTIIASGINDEKEHLLSFERLMKEGDYVPSKQMDPEDPFIMLYTSGTTGKPKGTVHVHGGSFINIVKEVKYYIDVTPQDTVFWITDLGWMMGPWYILGANALGASVFVYSGAVDYPSKDRVPDMIARHGITILGLSPTYVRMLKHSNYRRQFDGIRVFGSTGEPWDEEGWMYLFRDLGGSQVPIANVSGGTDIIGCFLASTPAIPMRPRCLYRGLGMNASVYNENGKEVYDEVAYLVSKKPCPSFTRSLWKQDDKYLESYWSRFKDVWFHGDWATMSHDGYFYILGRADDVIKVAGKRVGPNEVEDTVLRVHGVREAACVGIPDDIKGEGLVVFYMGDKSAEVGNAVKQEIEKSLGKSFSPKGVIWVSSLPRTRSGKIMRRLVRSAYLHLPYGDTNNLENPESLEEIAAIGKGE